MKSNKQKSSLKKLWKRCVTLPLNSSQRGSSFSLMTLPSKAPALPPPPPQKKKKKKKNVPSLKTKQNLGGDLTRSKRKRGKKAKFCKKSQFMSFFCQLLLFGFGFGKICVTFSKSCHIVALVSKISQISVHIAIVFFFFVKYRKKCSKTAYFLPRMFILGKKRVNLNYFVSKL